MRRHVLSLLALVVAAFLLAPELAAQRRPTNRPPTGGGGGVTTMCVGEGCGGGGGDTSPPLIWLHTPGDFYTQFPSLEIEFCDNAALNSGTRYISVNGTNYTSTFGYDTGASNECSYSAHAMSTTTSVALTLGQNTIYASICDNSENCTNQTWYVYRRAGPVPTFTLAPYSADLQDFGRCALSCFAATYAQGTVPYYSMDAPRSVTLVYNGARVDPKPFIHVNVTHTGNSGDVPTYFFLKVQKSTGSWITFLNGETELRFTASAGAALRIGGQFSAVANSMNYTAIFPVTVVVGAQYSGGREETTLSTRVIVVSENSSAIARGWTIAGLQRAFVQGDGSVLITEGEGSATWFAKSGANYIAPTGDFSRLTLTGSGGSAIYTRVYPDSTSVVFAATTGLMTRQANHWGDSTSIAYDNN